MNRVKDYMKKITLMAVIFCLTTGMVSGCGKKEIIEPESKVDLQTLLNDMTTAGDELPNMKTVSSLEEGGEEYFPTLCDIEYEKIQDYFYSYAEEGEAIEFAVVFVKNEADVKAVVRSLTAHKESRIKTFQNYAPAQVEVANKAMISYNGNYVCYVMGERASYMKAEFEKALDK